MFTFFAVVIGAIIVTFFAVLALIGIGIALTPVILVIGGIAKVFHKNILTRGE